MNDLVATACLTGAALLGSVSLVTMFAARHMESVRQQVTTTVGVVAFLTAIGRLLERGGLAAAVLLLLMTWFVYDTVRGHTLRRRTFEACAWGSLALLFTYIGFERG